MVGVDGSPESLGRREQKKLKTRRVLKDAALDLALEQGVESLTVEAISEAAEVAPRTFFNYFSCKEDALVSEAAEAAADLHRMIVERPSAEPPLRALRAVIGQSDAISVAHADRERFLARQRLVQEHPPLMSRQLAQYARVERTFADALAERLGVDPDQDRRPELLAALTVSVLRVAMRRWTTDGQQSLYQQIDAAFDLLERGELTEPGQHDA
ncbi:MAG TPA: TetR family transcriptional regulator [Jiangellaceae bacterium]|nr:TetR family transcriptional regulator [Jiangellaceae bacterium]